MPTQFSRRTMVAMLGGTTAVGPTAAWGHDLRPDDPSYRFREYEAIVNRSAQAKQVYQWPNIANAIIFANIRNGLNGFQFSYDIPPDEIQVVVQSYASANAATYDDFIWEKYRWGEGLSVRDPQTNQPATRNIWYGTTVAHATLTPGLQPTDRNHPFFDDVSIEGLQRRRVLFLA
ncbi:MAG: hypothetical protein JJE04_11635 [Acidobacteriia bacterium]|nr:hypothetical protein [Terriglobia bacterium]